MCHQSGGLVARAVERAGIPTASVGNVRERYERVKPPRALLVPFPRGALFGEPGNALKQREVLRAALRLLGEAKEPGRMVEGNFRWEGIPGGRDPAGGGA